MSNRQITANKKGCVFLICGASGTGKTSLLRRLLKIDKALNLSISHTTRKPRPNEVNGENYYFTDTASFQKMIQAGEFAEWANVHGNLYGTSLMELQGKSEQKDIILEIDYQGAAQIKCKIPSCTSIFILPPHWQALQDRLNKRGEDSESVIAQRLINAKQEIKHAYSFDYVIINQVFEDALRDIQAIISATRLTSKRQKQTIDRILFEAE